MTATVRAVFLCAVCVLVLSGTTSGNNQQVHRRFEYKYSFKPPYLAQKDGTVPFWEYGGSKYKTDNIYLYIYVYLGRHRLKIGYRDTSEAILANGIYVQ